MCLISCTVPPCSDSEEEYSELEDDSDFDEVNSPPAKPKVACLAREGHMQLDGSVYVGKDHALVLQS